MLPNYEQALSGSISGLINETGFTGPIEGKLGYGSGQGLIVANQTLRHVYWFIGELGAETRPAGVAILPAGVGLPLLDIASNEGLPIVLRYPPGTSPTSGAIPEVFRVSKEGYVATDGRLPEDQLRDRALHPSLAQLDLLRPQAEGATVIVKGRLFYRNPLTGRTGFLNDPSLSLADDITALSSGEHQLALVYFDPTTKQVKRILNTASAAGGSLPYRAGFQPAHVQTLMNSLPAFAEEITPVYLYYGQTELTFNDFYPAYEIKQIVNQPMEGVATLTTSDDTLTDALAVDVSEGQGLTITGRFVASKADYSAAIGGTLLGVFRRESGGNVTLVGATVTAHDDSSGTPAVTLAVDTGDQTGNIQFEGISAENWTLRLWYQIVIV